MDKPDTTAVATGPEVPPCARPPAGRAWTGPTRARIAGALAMVALVFAAHAPALTGTFIWDDDYWIEKNPVFWSGQAPWGYWSLGGKTADYLPVTSTFFWLQGRLWGTAPGGYHAVNVALHAGAALLLWRVLRKLSAPGAYLAALVFAVHPITAASAGWVAEQKNTLSMVLMLSALLAYLRFEDRPRVLWYAAAVLLFAGALLAKGSVVILPAVLIGAAWWRRGRVTWKDLLRSLPFWLLATAGAALTVAFQFCNAMGEDVDGPANLVERLVLAGRAVWFYLYKALLPVNLSPIYTRWDVHAVAWPDLAALGGLVAAMAALLVFARRPRVRPLTFALGYYFVALLPILGLVDTSYMRHSFVADHWHYLALPGLIALIVGGAWHWLAPRGQAGRRAGAALATAAVAMLSVLTYRQAGVYSGSIPLWTRTLELNDRTAAAHTNLAAALVNENRYDEALGHYRRGLEIKPGQAGTYNNIGLLYDRQKLYEQAIEHYRQALAIDPRYADAHQNLATALAHLERFEESAEHFRLALRHQFVEDPPLKIAARHDGLASALVNLDRPEEALGHYDQALKLAPDFAQARVNRAVALGKLAVKWAAQGQTDAALNPLRELLEQYPDDAELWLLRGEVLLRAGRLEQAASCFARLEQLQPGRARQHFELGRQAADAGRPGEAAEFYRKAVLGQENYAAALNNLAWLLATTDDDALRDGPAAVELAERACGLADPLAVQFRLCLAAAYAQAGRADDARATAQQAAEQADQAGNTDLARQIRALAEAYAEGRTYRQFRAGTSGTEQR